MATATQEFERTEASASFLAHDEIHEAWKNDYLDRGLEPLYERIFDRIAGAMRRAPGDRVLDAGCGSCIHAARLARRGLRITGVDFSGAALRRARRLLDAQGLGDRVDLVEGNLLDLPLPDRSFDAVMCFGVLMHVPEVETALRELMRVLAPGGRLILMENNAQSLQVRVWHPVRHGLKRALGRSDWQRQLTRRGVEEWKQTDTGGLMVRFTDYGWLDGVLGAHGLTLEEHFNGQFTELYTWVKWPLARRALFRLNETWFDWDLPRRLSLGNVRVYTKRRDA